MFRPTCGCQQAAEQQQQQQQQQQSHVDRLLSHCVPLLLSRLCELLSVSVLLCVLLLHHLLPTHLPPSSLLPILGIRLNGESYQHVK